MNQQTWKQLLAATWKTETKKPTGGQTDTISGDAHYQRNDNVSQQSDTAENQIPSVSHMNGPDVPKADSRGSKHGEFDVFIQTGTR